jgi:hypothetical protein
MAVGVSSGGGGAPFPGVVDTWNATVAIRTARRTVRRTAWRGLTRRAVFLIVPSIDSWHLEKFRNENRSILGRKGVRVDFGRKLL